MAKLTLQEQLLKAGLVTSKKAAKVERTAKKSRVQAREARAAVEENKKAQLERVANSKNKRRWRKNIKLR